MSVPEAAIAAAASVGEHHAGVFQVGHCADHYHVDSFECVAEIMLEAAAPIIAAEAWDEAHFGALGCDSTCCDYMHGAPEGDMNPYRAATNPYRG